MLFSIYPSDTDAVIDAVVAQARRGVGERMLFTSLHLPEIGAVEGFGGLLENLHRAHGLTFCADISPRTLAQLGGDPSGGGFAGLARLSAWGITVLRIDFGFAPDEIRRIAEHTGCRIAVNASTVDEEVLTALDGLPVIGWHNYYPRPETGLADEFYLAQNALFHDRGLPLYAFVPGEVSQRAPLHEGLPVLEVQRYRNAWRNYLHLKQLDPSVAVVCAEGTLFEEHLDWIEHAEETGEITVPLSQLDAAGEALLADSWRLRSDAAATSFRLEGTRGFETPARTLNADRRSVGSLQIDLDGWGRYRGEVHLMREDLALGSRQAWIGEIAAPYRGLVEDLRPGALLRFVRV